MAAVRRVALIADARNYVGPSLARLLAQRDHDLVLGDPREELVEELTATGAAVEAVTGVADLADPDAARALVAAALARFGRLDAACAASGQIVVGRFTTSSVEDLRTVLRGCVEAPYLFLQAVLPTMLERGDGQVLVITSASAARPTPGAPLYSSARAAANMLVRNVAGEVAATGVQVNAIGTNFMDFPAFLKANGIVDDPEKRAKVESMVPMKRLGGMDEFAHACAPFLDGTSRFTTGQFLAYAGGWA
jgi:NAD(P)-dependent dehydrogenase (short-subunit alcohol dehydrogenase family)